MSAVVSVTDFDVFAALKAFLDDILPLNTDVIQAQVNRVPEPEEDNFVVMTELRRERISTNVDSMDDVRFTGSIAGTVMTVSEVQIGTIVPDASMFGVGVALNTVIVAQLTGPAGGPGSYTVDPAQTFASATLASGAKAAEQSMSVAIQLDIHGPQSADNAVVISTLLRDAYGVETMAAQTNYGVSPLYAEDPRQAPFLNENNQYENRWVVVAMLQVNPVVTVPQQFADSVEVEVISVDERYPPS